MRSIIIGLLIGALALPALAQNAIERQIQCSDAGANDTYTCSAPVAPAAYVTGQHYRFSANTANTGTASINFNSLGAKTIVKVAGGITTTLADNDIRVGQWVDLVYDGTNMQMQSTLGNAAAGGTTKFSDSCPFAVVNMTGSDVTICTFSNVTLGAGKCLTFNYHNITSASGGTNVTTIKVGGTAVVTYAASGAGVHQGSRIAICNDPGVQNAQHFAESMGWYTNIANYTPGVGPQPNIYVGAGTSAINWATPQTVTVTENRTSGTVTVEEITLQEF